MKPQRTETFDVLNPSVLFTVDIWKPYIPFELMSVVIDVRRAAVKIVVPSSTVQPSQTEIKVLTETPLSSFPFSHHALLQLHLQDLQNKF